MKKILIQALFSTAFICQVIGLNDCSAEKNEDTCRKNLIKKVKKDCIVTHLFGKTGWSPKCVNRVAKELLNTCKDKLPSHEDILKPYKKL